ncbi:hypothetical protein BDV18DRAFT_163668 [Aspergillus unguis]
MKTTIISTITALALALPLSSAQGNANPRAWSINACGTVYTGTGSSACTPVSCEAGEIIDFTAGPTGSAIEFNLHADNACTEEITHFASDRHGYVLPRQMRSFLVLN